MKKQYYIMSLVILIVIIGIIIFFINRKKSDDSGVENILLTNEIQNISNIIDENNIIQNILSEQAESDNLDEIKNMQSQINSTANPNIYKIEEEYDGRKILQIKPEVQYVVDLAGVLKNGKPLENEINELLKGVPNKNGIWISEQSRQKFLNLLANNNINNFYTSDDGYLQSTESTENQLSTKLENMINSDNLYVINMTGIAYERDYISGEILEYPFEDMDPYQIIQPYKTGNKIILEITSNKNARLSDNEILETIITYE